MPGVVASWNGQCVDRQVQTELCEQLVELAETSNRIFFRHFREEIHSKFYNGSDNGNNYLIIDRVFGKQNSPVRAKQVDKGIFLGKNLKLFGLDFLLFDPRSHTPPFFHGLFDRVSFVFTRSEDPELDGWLVRACPINKQHRLSAVSQTVLTSPDIGLRYYLEDWTELFLGWVKHFYLPHLRFWLYRDLSGYDMHYGNVSRDKQTAAEHFRTLLTDFSYEAESFAEQMEHLKAEKEAREGDTESCLEWDES